MPFLEELNEVASDPSPKKPYLVTPLFPMLSPECAFIFLATSTPSTYIILSVPS